MKAVFVVNDLKHWICVGVVDSQQAADQLVESYKQVTINNEPIPLQSWVIDLPAVTG